VVKRVSFAALVFAAPVCLASAAPDLKETKALLEELGIGVTLQ
jgi:hypothetical protein